MNTAQKILAANSAKQTIESVVTELAISTVALNCFDRVWTYYDGSAISKTREGYVAK